MTVPSRGHRAVPHTADIRIEAWAPTREACLGEAVAALVESFADPATPVRRGNTPPSCRLRPRTTSSPVSSTK
ncbi:MAG TPA: archease [Actinophytocola sp.]|jgi:hypothetical protein|nr:archease [Actinophytocola sp.]